MSHDLTGLERNVGALGEAVGKLHEAKHADLLITIIHNPGWTSFPELQLVKSQVEDLHRRISGVHKALDTLVEIARTIGTK